MEIVLQQKMCWDTICHQHLSIMKKTGFQVREVIKTKYMYEQDENN